MPTAMVVGEQAGALGVPGKVHTQKSTGKPVTASMDAQVKLQTARAESQEVKQVVKEMPALLGTLSQEDATELVAGLDLRIDSLEGRIDQGQATLEAMKEGLNPGWAIETRARPGCPGPTTRGSAGSNIPEVPKTVRNTAQV